MPSKLMLLGDSITFGVGGLPSGYRAKLAAMLPDRQFVGSVTDKAGLSHEGHGGWAAQNILSHVKKFVEDAKPDEIMMMIGTNNFIDVPHDTKGMNKHPAENPDAVFELDLQIVDTIRKVLPNVKMYISSIPFVDAPISNAFNQLALAYNKILADGSGSAAKSYKFINGSALLNDAILKGPRGTYLLPIDATHPTPAGYALLAKGIGVALGSANVNAQASSGSSGGGTNWVAAGVIGVGLALLVPWKKILG